MDAIKDKKSIRTEYLIDLNKYNVIKRFDGGGFGQIYLIRDKKTNQQYAAKELKRTSSEKLINREISLMISLQHPTIAKIHGYSLHDFHDEDNVIIVMDYATNGSLYQILDDVRHGLSNVWYDNTARQKILIGIAYSMMYLHRHRVIHRDLKPGNVLIDEFYNPRLSDFGVSKY